MNQNEFLNSIFSALVNQAIVNQNNYQNPLPQDQQEVEKKIMDAIHDLHESSTKIKPEYRQQIWDAAVLKVATEIGWFNGGNR